jgi:hypothetical protein|tara:strand:- start:423 stop:542 length:120 start_codon:yes stop_codon:yes gene_type:complete
MQWEWGVEEVRRKEDEEESDEEGERRGGGMDEGTGLGRR